MKKLAMCAAFIAFLAPITAQAFGYQNPFAGMIIASVPCTCPPFDVTRITMLTPNGRLALDYRYGTQRYEGFNLPFARYLLGFYSTGSSCYDYAVDGCYPRVFGYPASGTITRTVGSSGI